MKYSLTEHGEFSIISHSCQIYTAVPSWTYVLTASTLTMLNLS